MKFAFAAGVIALAFAAPAFAQHETHEHGASSTAAAPSNGSVQGAGVVKAMNTKSGTITLHHGPIAALKWPAMTMTFKASTEVLKAAKAGQKVTFTLNAAGDEVTAIQ
jgi:Cu(I)/Ag(I) efflux system protein CusF